MDSKLLEILDEWEEGMFMFPELLEEAYTTFLGQLVGATAAERSDPRVIPFLLAGYTAYTKQHKGKDPQAALTYRMALAMDVKFREEVIQIKGLATASLPSEQLMADMLNTILERQRVASKAKDDDRVILEIQPSENTENPLWFSMRRTDQLSGQVIMDNFGFEELKKGHFPFLAGPDFYNYEGPLLDRELYCASGMKSKAAAEFNRWYDEQVSNNYLFNYKKDPAATVSVTSACMAAFRRNFLKKDTIGIAPSSGYHGMGKQSEIALKWLDFESHKIGKVIKTIYTDREVSVMGRRVDGYVEVPKRNGSVEKRIYQFHGCYWHQCPIHFPPSPECGENRLEQTRRLTEIFQLAGYKVIEKWECQFKADLKNNPDTQAYFNAHPTTRVPPLNLRDTLAGGRTSALRWYYKADTENGEKIKLVDVVSEYPGCNLRGKYPISHPRIFREGDPEMPTVDQWNGLVKCTVLPPRDLFLPVLWVKAHGKLLFPLCRTCVETQNMEVCRHDDPNLRQLTGSWCSPELQLAILEKGYELKAVHEVLQYPASMQFDPETGTDGLLSAYVRCFMALKIEASGWPPHCESDEQKKEFVADVLKRDGIVINPDNMIYRPALRVLNPTKEVRALVPLGDDCLQVNWMPVEDSEESLPTSSLVHAAFTTCLGRMQLYKYLDLVGKRALYHDTDSVCYISRPGELDLPLGTHLGDLTDQVEEELGPGSFITEIVCGGPKNYAFKAAKGGDTNNIHVTIK
ncbi:uncharacterized protein LOC127750506, partial [Frankliniella occidentalis]|uniref:Uncharacterized protein LOC127750506 n=1 Tax=Frankliniella occidentalis TaxID=133901 RepID=A0A9C6XRD2_FRAOC